MTVFANAKLNLALNVTGTDGGLHTLDMVTVSVDLADEVELSVREDDCVTLVCDGGIPTEKNTAYRAAVAFVAAFKTRGVDIKIRKRIPFEAGMGGSSADAAAVLNAMKELFCVCDEERISAIARAIGSDVSPMRQKGFLRVRGTGELIEKIASEKELHFVVLQGENGSFAKDVYRTFDIVSSDVKADVPQLVLSIEQGDLEGISKNLKNQLAKASMYLVPSISEAFAALKRFSPNAVSMTGSGSAVFGLFGSAKRANEVAAALKGEFPFALAVKSVF